jgi:hypothetical protein
MMDSLMGPMVVVAASALFALASYTLKDSVNFKIVSTIKKILRK